MTIVRSPRPLRLRSARRAGAAGFTLLELIVAAGILALIAVFSWRGLDTLIREREAIASSQATIDALQRSFARIEHDALLASDAQIDDGGTMRLVAGNASAEGASAATVEYRLVSGALTRSVVGVDRAPIVVLDGIATLSIEAWLPAQGGGTWVRSKKPATEVPRPVVRAAPGTASASAPGTAGVPTAGSASGTGATTAGTQRAGTGTAGNAAASPQAPQAPAGPIVAAATGIRLVFARGDGAPVMRSFLVGGG